MGEEGGEKSGSPSRCHPEEHARTRCVISDCLPGFVGGWVVGCIQQRCVAGIGGKRRGEGQEGEKESPERVGEVP